MNVVTLATKKKTSSPAAATSQDNVAWDATIREIVAHTPGQTLVELGFAFKQKTGLAISKALGMKLSKYLESSPVYACEKNSAGGSTVSLVSFGTHRGRAMPVQPPVAVEAAVSSLNHMLVVTQEDCLAACRQLNKATVIAVDCEGVNLGRDDDELCLIQVACGTMVFLFDCVDGTVDEFADAGLRDVLGNVGIIKLFHDCRMDVTALAARGLEVVNILDSQLAWCLHTRERDLISLNDFLREVIDKEHPLKHNAPHKKDRTAWSRRPLSQGALDYAAYDVALLLEVAPWLRAHFQAPARIQQLENDTIIRVRRACHNVKGREGSVDLFSAYRAHRGTEVYEGLVVEQRVELEPLFEALPGPLVEAMFASGFDLERDLVDIILDVDRPAKLIPSNGPSNFLGYVVGARMFEELKENVGHITDANRACVGHSLHRCSFIVDHDARQCVGATIRVARSVCGVASYIEDHLIAGDGRRKSVLLVGAPGSGKTTLLRDVARLLASRKHDKRVTVVDTNNEIGGEGTRPHESIGDARRMKVGPRSRQNRVMLEAVQNHTPEVLLIDEVGGKQEVTEAIGISQRGVQLIATTHGRTLADVILNPDLRNLVGGVNTVILSASERQRDGAVSKTRIERAGPPAFDVCIELHNKNRWVVHSNVQASVDAVLHGLDQAAECEVREMDFAAGSMRIRRELFPDLETSDSVRTGL